MEVLVAPNSRMDNKLIFSRVDHASARGESMALHITAAMAAGVTGSCITNPLWVVKTRFMVSVF